MRGWGLCRLNYQFFRRTLRCRAAVCKSTLFLKKRFEVGIFLLMKKLSRPDLKLELLKLQLGALLNHHFHRNSGTVLSVKDIEDLGWLHLKQLKNGYAFGLVE
ncbi:hypothetical protein CEXT_323541 [Caerostris extrusa]|uniref:Uncharacterized protein n=1 Tax=Caerostris extrusa TaxID=172846 RepID=A0AAV4SB78_CAEEX|nr:hypothetical protein CEXT_323541 [Caerostris extrusa]